MTNHEFILNLLKDGRKHCSNEIPFRDERARVGELRRGKNRWHKQFSIVGEPCRGRCGRQHDSDVHWLWLEDLSQIKEIDLPDDKPAIPKESPYHKANITSSAICCNSYILTGYHMRACPQAQQAIKTSQQSLPL